MTKNTKSILFCSAGMKNHIIYNQIFFARYLQTKISFTFDSLIFVKLVSYLLNNIYDFRN